MEVGLFGKKLGMTQIFDDQGSIIPVTLVEVKPCQVSQIKTIDSDSYNAIQIAYFEENLNRLTKPTLGHLKKSGDKGFKSFAEFRVSKPQDYKLGQKITVDSLDVGQKVKVSGNSIGKGFAGNQKRHNFTRGPMTHGSKNHRAPGSIGMGTTPGRVLPGKKMAGQLGNKFTTIKNLKVIQLSSEENILIIKGSIPGKPGNLLSITPSN